MKGRRLSRLTFVALTLTLLLSAAALRPAVSQRRAGRDARGGPVALVPGATFRMGTDPSDFPRLQQLYGIRRAELFSGEAPPHAVTVGAFYMDRYEVPNARFKEFLDKNPRWRRERIPPRFHNGNYLKHWVGGGYPVGKGDHPVTNVGWHAAAAFCLWAGKRLPTEAEWEHAARGGLADREFPWGDEPPDGTRANYLASGIGGTTRVGSYPANGYGLFDMAGNVWEYTADEWAAYPTSPQVNPLAGGNLFLNESFHAVTSRRVIRGGSWGGAPVNLRVAYRDSHPPEGARDFVGFRCAMPASSGGR